MSIWSWEYGEGPINSLYWLTVPRISLGGCFQPLILFRWIYKVQISLSGVCVHPLPTRHNPPLRCMSQPGHQNTGLQASADQQLAQI